MTMAHSLQSSLTQNHIRSDPAIHKLHPDILWSIFKINANIHAVGPLKTARFTSQVCHMWRGIILTSPTIWGSILDLTDLQIRKEISLWRDEIMERTGNVLLCIKGEIPVLRLYWFLHFLEAYWERVRFLDVQPIGFAASALKPNICKFMKKSPRNLEVFHCPRIRFDLRSPWITNLCSITLSAPFTTCEILDCLGEIHRLESMRIQQWRHDLTVTTVRSQKITLSRLTDIYISNTFNAVISILRNIIPATECSLTMCTYGDSLLETPEVITIGHEILSGYIERCLNSRNTNSFLLILEDGYAVVTIPGDPFTPSFSIQLLGNSNATPGSEVPVFLGMFSSRNLAPRKIAQLSLVLHDDQQTEHFSDSLVEFVRAFSSVSRLFVSGRGLRFLGDMHAEASDILPSLEALHLADEGAKPGLEAAVSHFLHQRTLYGTGVKQLDITSVAKLSIDWRFLDVFHGMKVIWRVSLEDSTFSEYLCGSGNPEELDMRIV